MRLPTKYDGENIYFIWVVHTIYILLYIYNYNTKKHRYICSTKKNFFLLLVCKKVVMLIARSARYLSLKYKIYEGMGSLVLYIVICTVHRNERIFAAIHTKCRGMKICYIVVNFRIYSYGLRQHIRTPKYICTCTYIKRWEKTCIEKA